MPSLVSAEESSTPSDANITVRLLVSEPNSSVPICKNGMMALGTHPFKVGEILLNISEERFDLSNTASAEGLRPWPISFSIL